MVCQPVSDPWLLSRAHSPIFRRPAVDPARPDATQHLFVRQINLLLWMKNVIGPSLAMRPTYNPFPFSVHCRHCQSREKYNFIARARTHIRSTTNHAKNRNPQVKKRISSICHTFALMQRIHRVDSNDRPVRETHSPVLLCVCCCWCRSGLCACAKVRDQK